MTTVGQLLSTLELERNRRRKWKLKRLAIDKNGIGGSETAFINNDFEDIMRYLKEDPVSRANVNIYKDQQVTVMAVETDDDASECGGVPRITLPEMLNDVKVVEDDSDEKWEDDDDGNE